MSKQLLRRFPKQEVNFIFFSDEEIFTVTTHKLMEWLRERFRHSQKARDVDASRILRTLHTFSRSVMASVAIWKLGCMQLWNRGKNRWCLLTVNANELGINALLRSYWFRAVSYMGGGADGKGAEFICKRHTSIWGVIQKQVNTGRSRATAEAAQLMGESSSVY